ncbi:MAG: cytochrome c oxidase subunit 3 family protein [Chloroflexota bacterium]
MNIKTEVSVHSPAHAHRDDFGSKMGMWLFLVTEMLLFGGLFLVYMTYRVQFSKEFHLAARELDVFMGTFNTMILLTSSLTMALSITAITRGKRKQTLAFLCATEMLALGFLIIKAFEWGAKIQHGIFPGSAELQSLGNGEILFFGLYYVMTGLHGLHVLVGMGLILFGLVGVWRGSIEQTKYVRLENFGLYWHLVDLIWIFLFPLFYLLH